MPNAAPAARSVLAEPCHCCGMTTNQLYCKYEYRKDSSGAVSPFA